MRTSRASIRSSRTELMTLACRSKKAFSNLPISDFIGRSLSTKSFMSFLSCPSSAFISSKASAASSSVCWMGATAGVWLTLVLASSAASLRSNLPSVSIFCFSISARKKVPMSRTSFSKSWTAVDNLFLTSSSMSFIISSVAAFTDISSLASFGLLASATCLRRLSLDLLKSTMSACIPKTIAFSWTNSSCMLAIDEEAIGDVVEDAAAAAAAALVAWL
mmetsp:Transcript_1930/g.4463  ORF Transcript_1930/g.4463 Transcript_1930/m.4463 type:complete len:219 (+) Transcript_1930:558-1214(+)